MSRIVNGDNFDSDYPNERFLECGGAPIQLNEERAKRLAEILNELGGPYSSRIWRVVDDRYVLAPGFEP